MIGTYGYIAPEEFLKKAVPATDLYSLGVTLLRMLTGLPPTLIPQDNLKFQFKDLLPNTPALVAWLEKMTEPELSKRFRSADQARNLLAELLARLKNNQVLGVQNTAIWEDAAQNHRAPEGLEVELISETLQEINFPQLKSLQAWATQLAEDLSHYDSAIQHWTWHQSSHSVLRILPTKTQLSARQKAWILYFLKREQEIQFEEKSLNLSGIIWLIVISYLNAWYWSLLASETLIIVGFFLVYIPSVSWVTYKQLHPEKPNFSFRRIPFMSQIKGLNTHWFYHPKIHISPLKNQIRLYDSQQEISAHKPDLDFELYINVLNFREEQNLRSLTILKLVQSYRSQEQMIKKRQIILPFATEAEAQWMANFLKQAQKRRQLIIG